MAIYRKGESQFELQQRANLSPNFHEDSDEGKSWALGAHEKGINTIDFGVSGDHLALGNEERPMRDVKFFGQTGMYNKKEKAVAKEIVSEGKNKGKAKDIAGINKRVRESIRKK